MRKVRHVRDLRRLLASAIWDGAERQSATTWRWNVAAGCTQPVHFTMEGRAPSWGSRDDWETWIWSDPMDLNARPLMEGGTAAHDTPLWIDVEARCRKCLWCLKQRASLWSMRARQEIQGSQRTWFGTLTLRPEEHFLAACRADAKHKRREVAWAELSPAEQFKARHNAISEEITKWLKRVRKESGARFRYCLVAEAHKSGLPHYHVLIHERWLAGTIGERTLRRQWKLGHSKFNLVSDAGAAWYVAKYLAKASEARVRASARYGKLGL